MFKPIWMKLFDLFKVFILIEAPACQIESKTWQKVDFVVFSEQILGMNEH